MQPVIYADFRCLQDQNFLGRGIGYHNVALLRARARSKLSACKLIGLVDARMPQLPPGFSSLADEISSSVNPCLNGTDVVFIDGSPMTHDSRFDLRFQNHPAALRAAVLYDFIPMDWPGYLPTAPRRMEYTAKLARLRKFDLYLPISEYTAWRLKELLNPASSQVSVTGACVRRSLYEIQSGSRETPSPYAQDEPYFVTFGGDDRRKNTDIAVKAVRHLNLLYGRRIPLKVIGFYSVAYKHELLTAAGGAENAGFLEFYPKALEEKVFYGDSPDRWVRPSIPDAELVALHAGAIAAIAPSHIEGFSLPVVEASVCGCPVIASTCAAHMELIDRPEALFQSDDAAALSEKLEALLNDPALRTSLVESQARLAPKFHEDEVGRRFWKAIEAAVDRRGMPVLSHKTKPRLAFLSPYPPDEADAALYTALTMRGGRKFFDSDLYTDADRPFTSDDTFREAGKVGFAPLLDGGCNAVVSVLGNDPSHSRVFDVFERYGGPCVLHDVQLAEIYLHLLGRERFLNFAAEHLGRPTSMDEVNTWLQHRNPPPLLLKPIIERASPLIVETPAQRALIKKHYGADAQILTSCPTILFNDAELTGSHRQTIRRQYGVPEGAFVIAVFGQVTRSKGTQTCILAAELIRSWSIPAELYFIGDAGSEDGEVHRIAALYDVAAHVHSGTEFAGEAAHRNFLIAADAAVQLQPYPFGQLSTTVTGCISAGLPCVTTSDLAESAEAPAFVTTVPDCFSPLQVAEQLALVWEAHSERSSHEEARRAYLDVHNCENRGRRLIEILGFA
jgi:glycosyltransferase involved in cell wall biosynthesis